MIEYASAICAAGLVLFAAGHLLLALVFLYWHRARQKSRSGILPEQLPPAAILIAARGLDSTFVRMLQAVSNQAYPDFEVVIVADDFPDWESQWLPGWKPVFETRASGADHPEILSLVSEQASSPKFRIVRSFKVHATCGLKCSALIAGWSTISDRVEVCAFLDTDVVPGPNWLATLAGEAIKPDCGSASGVQWFEAPDCNAGTLIRSLWNSAAVFPVAIFGNPWAGSMAIRREVIERSGLIQRWAHSIVDDGPVRKAVNSLGLNTRFVPGLVMVNRESCGFGFAVNWIGRMVKWSSIFDPDFRNTLVHACISSILFVMACVTVMWAAVTGSHAWWWSLAGLVVGNFLYVAGWFVMRCSLLKNGFDPLEIPQKNDEIAGLKNVGPIFQQAGCASVTGPSTGNQGGSTIQLPLVLLACLVLVTVTQVVFCIQALRAPFSRLYVWRGIVYDVSPDGIVSFDSASGNSGNSKS